MFAVMVARGWGGGGGGGGLRRESRGCAGGCFQLCEKGGYE